VVLGELAPGSGRVGIPGCSWSGTAPGARASWLPIGPRREVLAAGRLQLRPDGAVVLGELAPGSGHVEVLAANRLQLRAIVPGPAAS
jgi:hypothetical protein